MPVVYYPYILLSTFSIHFTKRIANHRIKRGFSETKKKLKNERVLKQHTIKNRHNSKEMSMIMAEKRKIKKPIHVFQKASAFVVITVLFSIVI